MRPGNIHLAARSDKVDAGQRDNCLQTAAREVEKLPNEVAVDCYTVSLLHMKTTIEQQMKRLQEELLAGLRRKVGLCSHSRLPRAVGTDAQSDTLGWDAKLLEEKLALPESFNPAGLLGMAH